MATITLHSLKAITPDMPKNWRDPLLRWAREVEAALNPVVVVSKIFVNPLAGFVLIGRPNSLHWRFWIDDTDQTNPQLGVEAEGAPIFGDYLFPNNVSGIVQYGRTRGGLYRWWIDDSDIINPMVMLEKLTGTADVLATDFFFADPAALWVNTARPNSTKWAWWVSDTDGSDLSNVKVSVERWP